MKPSIKDMPIVRISKGVMNLMKKDGSFDMLIPVSYYARTVKPRRGEIGCTNKFRYVLSS